MSNQKSDDPESRESGWLAPMRVEQITFGVRYEPQHAVMDHIGAIVDEVLRGKDSPFTPDVFPFLQALPHEHRLFNNDSEALLRITARDTILIMPAILESAEFLQKTASDFDEFVLEPIRQIAKLGSIVRHGVLLNLSGKSADLRNPPIKRYLSQELLQMSRANSMLIRFTKKLATDEALTRKGVDDFRNVIYTAEESENGDVNISVDYQQYFQPSLSGTEWAARTFPKFAWHASGYLQGEFSKWLERSIGVAEVA